MKSPEATRFCRRRGGKHEALDNRIIRCRIGAMTRRRPQCFVAAVVLVFAAVACRGDDAGSTLDGEAERQLTGPEAAALVQADRASGIQADLGSPTILIITKCEATDFNQTSGAWIVVCENTAISSNGTYELEPRTYRLFDASGEIERVE